MKQLTKDDLKQERPPHLAASTNFLLITIILSHFPELYIQPLSASRVGKQGISV